MTMSDFFQYSPMARAKNGEISYSDITTEAAKADMTIDKAEIEKFIGGDQS